MLSTYLSFTISDEYFAVNVISVLEVLQKQRITWVPNAPDFIKGIINFRGEVVPVFESRIKFNYSARADNSKYVIIVLEFTSGGDNIRIGAIVDKVKDVISVDDQDIKPVPLMSKDFNAQFLKGIFRLNDEFIMILDVEKVFSTGDLFEIKNIEGIKEQIIS